MKFELIQCPFGSHLFNVWNGKCFPCDAAVHYMHNVCTNAKYESLINATRNAEYNGVPFDPSSFTDSDLPHATIRVSSTSADYTEEESIIGTSPTPDIIASLKRGGQALQGERAGWVTKKHKSGQNTLYNLPYLVYWTSSYKSDGYRLRRCHPLSVPSANRRPKPNPHHCRWSNQGTHLMNYFSFVVIGITLQPNTRKQAFDQQLGCGNLSV